MSPVVVQPAGTADPVLAAVAAVAPSGTSPVVVLGSGAGAERLRRDARTAGRPAHTVDDTRSLADAAGADTVVIVTAPYLPTGAAPGPELFGAAAAVVVDLAPEWTGARWAGRDWIDLLVAAAGAGWRTTGSGDRAGDLVVVLERGDAGDPAVVAAYEERLAELSAVAAVARTEVAVMRHQVLRSTDRVIGVEAELSTLRHHSGAEIARLAADGEALRARIAELLGSRSWRIGQSVLSPARRLRG